MAYKYNHVHDNASIKEMLKLLRLSKADEARYKKVTTLQDGESANIVGDQMSFLQQQLVDEGGCRLYVRMCPKDTFRIFGTYTFNTSWTSLKMSCFEDTFRAGLD